MHMHITKQNNTIGCISSGSPQGITKSTTFSLSKLWIICFLLCFSSVCEPLRPGGKVELSVLCKTPKCIRYERDVSAPLPPKQTHVQILWDSNWMLSKWRKKKKKSFNCRKAVETHYCLHGMQFVAAWPSCLLSVHSPTANARSVSERASAN